MKILFNACLVDGKQLNNQAIIHFHDKEAFIWFAGEGINMPCLEVENEEWMREMTRSPFP